MKYCLIACALAIGLISAANAQTLFYQASTTKSVGTTTTLVVAAGTYKNIIQLCTLPASTANVWLNPTGATAVVSSGIPVWSGGGCTNFGTVALPIPIQDMNGITDSGSAQTLVVTGG